MQISINNYWFILQADKNTSPGSVGELRTKEGSQQAIENIKQLSTETAKVDERRKCGLRESTNYLMSLSCDLYRLYYCTIAIIIIIINFISDQHLLKHYIQFFWVLVNTFSLR